MIHVAGPLIRGKATGTWLGIHTFFFQFHPQKTHGSGQPCPPVLDYKALGDGTSRRPTFFNHFEGNFSDKSRSVNRSILIRS